MALVYIIDRGRGVRATLPATLVAGIVFAIAQFATSNYLSSQLTDIVASLLSAVGVVLLLRVWRPATPYVESEEPEIEERERVHVSRRAARGEDQVAGGVPAAHAGGSDHAIDTGARTAEEYAARDRGVVDTRSDVFKAYAPYVIIIIIFSLSQLPGIKDVLAAPGGQFKWPGLDLQTASGKPSTIPVFKLNWLSAAGTLMLIAGIVSIPVIGISLGKAVRTYFATYRQLLPAIITVMAVLGLAYVMNASGQTATLGLWMAGAGSAFAIISPVLGWLGVAVTGSDTSSNSLFGALQVSAANQVGLSKVLMAAANSSGGVLGKMISPQNLAIAAAAVGLSGREGDIFRKIIGWSLGFLVFMCLLVYLQSTPVLSWMVP
jgi:lactate permease